MTATVLVVDDHPSFRSFARRLLQAAGFSVVDEAGDAASALAAVRELRPDVVLLDVLLPDMTGFRACGGACGGSECSDRRADVESKRL